jgi:hypothetical protein
LSRSHVYIYSYRVEAQDKEEASGRLEGREHTDITSFVLNLQNQRGEMSIVRTTFTQSFEGNYNLQLLAGAKLYAGEQNNVVGGALRL